MAHPPISLVVAEHTTSAEIAGFLRHAREIAGRPDAGLRARHHVGTDGKHDGKVLLYVRGNSRPETLADRIAAFIEDVKAFFDAKEEYRLAALTLLKQARLAASHEMEFQDGTRLCPILARVSEGKAERLTIQNTHHAWQAAFTDDARLHSAAVFSAFREDIAGLKGLPATKQKNGQAPGQVVDKGVSELFYLEALLSVPFDCLSHFEEMHLRAMFRHLGQPITDESLCEMKERIASLIHVACAHTTCAHVPSTFPATNPQADIAHIEDLIAFAQAWVSAWAVRPERDDVLRYNHVLALDYLSCMLLTTYRPGSEVSGQARQLLTSIAGKKPGDNYRSVWVALEREFVNWLRLGKPAHEFFLEKQTDMPWNVSGAD